MNCPACHGTGWISGRPCTYEGCFNGIISCCEPILSTPSPPSSPGEDRLARCEPVVPSTQPDRAGSERRGPGVSEMRRIAPEFRSGNQVGGEIEWMGKVWSVPELERLAEVCDDPAIARSISAQLNKIR